tara:strand:+ start:651 stop:1232 length:582 start_codon:yes stop_codon:yes gene_type:complete
MINILVIIHSLIIAISNALVHIPIVLFGFKLSFAAFVYPLIVLVTDLTVRELGSNLANKTIKRTFPYAIFISILIVFLEKNNLTFAIRIGLASSISYGIGTLIDVHVFQKIRNKYSYWWLAPLLSTIVSNIIDTYSFFIVAFYNSSDVYMNTHWVELATTLTIIKIIIGALFFLPLYGIILKRINKEKKCKIH